MAKKLLQTRKAIREDLRNTFPNWRKVSGMTGVAYETILAFVESDEITDEELCELDDLNLEDDANFADHPLLPQSHDIYILRCELTRAANCGNPNSAREIAADAILRFFAFDNSLVKAIERLPKRSGAK